MPSVKNMSKNIIKNLSSKYSQKVDHAKKSTNALKTASKRTIKKKQTTEAAGDLIGNKVAVKIISLKNFSTEWFRDSSK